MRPMYPIDHPHDLPFEELVAMLGRTGATLVDISVGLGLPVPPGFTLTTAACRDFLATGSFDAAVVEEARILTKGLGRDDHLPLLVSVRPSTPTVMPGALSVVLNVGLNNETVEQLANATGDERFAYDSYRRLIQMYGNVVSGVPSEEFERRVDGAKAMAGVTTESALGVSESRLLAQNFLTMLDERGTPFPQDIDEQVRGAVEAAFHNWDSPHSRAYRQRESISHDVGMAVVVQQMVFGNRDERSGTGLAFTRNPVNGSKEPYGDFRVGGQGIDDGTAPVIGVCEMKGLLPEAWRHLEASFAILEAHYRDMLSIDFTVEQGQLQFLGVRPGDRSGAAAVRIAKQLAAPDDLGLDRRTALLRVTADHLDQILHPQFSGPGHTPIATGLGASPGAAVGAVYFDPNTAVDAYDEGIDVILVKDETSPEDVHGMAIAEGILTTKGGLASHAAVVARGWGKPAVCGAGGITIGESHFSVGGLIVREGDIVSLDGATGEVFLGAVDLSEGDVPSEMNEILSWADEVRAGKMSVRANADTPLDALIARDYGAEGIGLCRTEHQFLGERLPIVQRMILAETEEQQLASLVELAEVQRADFMALLEAMDGLPVTVRLLDPPLHEFLPDVTELLVREARSDLSVTDKRLLAAAQAHHEENPMLGTRGVRLGILKPHLYRTQVRALLSAAAERADGGGTPIVEIMIPLIVNRQELELVRSWIAEEIEQVNADRDEPLEVSVGTMIETPRAAIRAGEIANVADFFSFGTNDLTQMTFGFSRDDVESSFIRLYCDLELLGANPFDTIDEAGVGELVRRAAVDARATKPGIKLGVCGEHGGDPASIDLFWRCGLDYVSCSPFRVPIARLAVAQAIVRSEV